MAKFMLLARDVPADFADMSPDEMQRIIEKYIAWGARLEQAGKMGPHEKLRDGEGRVARGSGKAMKVTDGPFSETKEIVGGFWIIEADTYDEALQLAQDCPHLEYGASLEIRAVEAL